MDQSSWRVKIEGEYYMATAKKIDKNIISLKSEQDIAAQVEILRADISELAKIVKVQAQNVAEQKASTVKNVVKDTRETATTKYRDITTSAETSIREKPLTAMAIAVGAGLMLGAMSRR